MVTLGWVTRSPVSPLHLDKGPYPREGRGAVGQPPKARHTGAARSRQHLALPQRVSHVRPRCSAGTCVYRGISNNFSEQLERRAAARTANSAGSRGSAGHRPCSAAADDRAQPKGDTVPRQTSAFYFLLRIRACTSYSQT